jgi:hypothetical protein
MRTNPWAPTAKAVLASGDSATSVGGNPVATAAPLGEGAATVEVRSVNENRLLGVGTPATSTLTGPVTASPGTSTTSEVGVTSVPSTYPANPWLVLK